MDGPRDFHTKQVRKRKTNTISYPLHVESKIWYEPMDKAETDSRDIENRLVVAKRVGSGKVME